MVAAPDLMGKMMGKKLWQPVLFGLACFIALPIMSIAMLILFHSGPSNVTTMLLSYFLLLGLFLLSGFLYSHSLKNQGSSAPLSEKSSGGIIFALFFAVPYWLTFLAPPAGGLNDLVFLALMALSAFFLFLAGNVIPRFMKK